VDSRYRIEARADPKSLLRRKDPKYIPLLVVVTVVAGKVESRPETKRLARLGLVLFLENRAPAK
jgi:hypothetical protein